MTRLIDADALLEEVNKEYIQNIRDRLSVERAITNAPTVQQSEPFGYFKAEPFGWTDCAETDEGAIALYEAPTVQREGWVSVDDRLPELGQWYLIFVKDKFATMAFLDAHTETGETLWLAHNNNFQGEWENVTHWQHLPSAPNE